MTGGPVPTSQKYTVVSRGIWKWIRDKLSIAPNRSSGNPIPQMYRMPAPGSQPSNSLDRHGRTYPAADIANNPYHKRDYRRNYPQTAVFNQSSLAGLLLYGNQEQPKIGKGDEGAKQLATVANNEVNLVDVLKSQDISTAVLENGLSPMPAKF